MKEEGHLESDVVKGDKFADKAIYSITEKGKQYFETLMHSYASQDVTLLFDFNVVIANLNKVSADDAVKLVSKLRKSIKASAKASKDYAIQYADIPLVGRTIFE